jgi:hypothetical protein
MKDLGDISWFLGIKIIRDRKNRTMQLSQDSYIAKVASKFELDNISKTENTKSRLITVPISKILSKSTDIASASEVHEFQQKVGSILYAAICTRPDAAFAASHLSQFLTNPNEEHMSAANQCISYLYSTRTLAIEFGTNDSYLWASDAAFADDPDNRKSTQAFLMTVFGGPVMWKSGKQDTVTTSTTEAELLAFTNTAKEAMSMHRICNAIGLDFDDEKLTIHCDNAQTIRLLTKEEMKLQTRLKHVDIHRNWGRQEIQSGRLHVQFLPTNEMPADGFTKPLTAQQMQRFIHQLGMRLTDQV